LPVLAPRDASARFSDASVFVVTIWGARGRDRMSDRVSALQTLGCKRVVPFGPLAWKYPEGMLPHYAVDLPHKALEQAGEVAQAFDLWADAESRREYLAQLRWRLFFDASELGPPNVDSIYFPPDLFRLSAQETFVDCGAFDGDTLADFLARSGGSLSKYVAFEPDPQNFGRLATRVAALPAVERQRIELQCGVVAGEIGVVRFVAGSGPASHVGDGELEVKAVTLDECLGDTRATFIKMDIEGAEPEALLGARRQIVECRPILAISCYHLQDHLWKIPLLIRSIAADYALYLRPHDLDGWDLVCYAIPPSRAL
jgi:FkbM family methyltransferase